MSDKMAPDHWPKGVTMITLDEFGKMGVDTQGRLYWDGKKVAYRLAGAERVALFVTAASAFFVGLESALRICGVLR